MPASCSGIGRGADPRPGPVSVRRTDGWVSPTRSSSWAATSAQVRTAPAAGPTPRRRGGRRRAGRRPTGRYGPPPDHQRLQLLPLLGRQRRARRAAATRRRRASRPPASAARGPHRPGTAGCARRPGGRGASAPSSSSSISSSACAVWPISVSVRSGRSRSPRCPAVIRRASPDDLVQRAEGPADDHRDQHGADQQRGQRRDDEHPAQPDPGLVDQGRVDGDGQGGPGDPTGAVERGGHGPGQRSGGDTGAEHASRCGSPGSR